MKALIQCNGIWFAGGKYGLSWKALQVRVAPPESLSGYSFVAESDDEEVDEVSADEDGGAPATGTLDALDNQVVDSSSSDDSSDEDDEEPVVVKVAKRGRKKRSS